MSMAKRYGLSKSKITDFEQCPRKLWLNTHRPELEAEDLGAQARIAAGNAVGDVACAAVPAGVMIHAEPDLAAAAARTAELMAGPPAPMFEATFSHDGVLVRCDVMEPDGEKGWHVAEIKASNGPKDYHWRDIATQLWVMRGAGVKVSRTSIRHLDGNFRLTEDGNYTGLFVDARTDENVEAIAASRAEVVAAARAMLAGPEPQNQPGAHCTQPFACGFSAWCGRDLPNGPEWPITELPYSGRTVAAKWAAQGIDDLTNLPAGALKSAMHERIRIATVSGDPFHDIEAALAAMKGWAWPLIYLDFETVQHAIPRWIGTGPYQQVPFQFSAHIEARDGTTRHERFLSIGDSDPRPGIAAALAALPRAGTVVAWNASFEKRCLLDLAAQAPEHGPALLSLANRVVDLKPVTQASWYHRDQRGSFSLKYVLPTIAPALNYGGLEVKDGGNAVEAWHEAANPATSSARVVAIRAALEAYCERDTWAMVVIRRWLAGEG
jgi:CRISPR/Cas system-associated exonuclease Cas4 (RecB family)